ncbi:MAG: ComF family protein [Bacteroidota bacterium]
MLAALSNILFPNLCVGCNGVLLKAENQICTFCLDHFPETGFHLMPENDLEKTFWGRVRLQRAFSFLVFRKKGIVQKLLHELKYANNPELGILLGRLYASKLKRAGLTFDAVIAIPLHASKQKLRGYNQSDCFAQGLSEVFNCAHLTTAVKRNKSTETQTRKDRIQRWDNVETVFEVVQPDTIQGKNILLVDDVITTGATIEACAQSILKHTDKLSVASIACVVNQ